MRPASKKKGNLFLIQPDRQSSKSMCLHSNSKEPRSIIRCTKKPSSIVKRLLRINSTMSTEANSKNQKKNSKCLLCSRETAAESSRLNSNHLMINSLRVVKHKNSNIWNSISKETYYSFNSDRMDQWSFQKRTTESIKTCSKSRSSQKHHEKNP